MTLTKNKEASVNNKSQAEVYRMLIIKAVAESEDIRFLHSMYQHSKCLGRTLKIK